MKKLTPAYYAPERWSVQAPRRNAVRGVTSGIAAIASSDGTALSFSICDRQPMFRRPRSEADVSGALGFCHRYPREAAAKAA